MLDNLANSAAVALTGLIAALNVDAKIIFGALRVNASEDNYNLIDAM